MGTLWQNMGFIRWPLTFSLLAVLGLGVWCAVQLFRSGAAPRLHTKAWVDAVLFWGAFAVITGVLGTLIGLTVTAESIAQAGGVQPSLAWRGVQVTMLSSITGMLILAVAALLWFVLQLRWRILLARSAVPGTS